MAFSLKIRDLKILIAVPLLPNLALTFLIIKKNLNIKYFIPLGK